MRACSLAVSVVLLVGAISGACSGAEYNVGVYYYPWYGDGDFHGGADTSIRWHLVPQQRPVLGWYNSHHPEVVSAHLIWARSAGVDFLAASYWGSWDDTAWTIRNCLLTSPDLGDLKICVFLEPSITVANVGSETEYLCDHFFGMPGYYRIDGKPVIFAYDVLTFSDANLTAYVNNIRTAARNKGVGEVYLVGDEAYGVYPRSSPTKSSAYRCSLFDAVTAYNPYGQLRKWTSAKYVSNTTLNTWKSNNDKWKALANSVGVDFFPSVEPGFNDSPIRGTKHVSMSRKIGSESGAPGSLFAGMLDRAKLNCDRATIMVTSWNEWHEDTQIEPVAPGPATNVVSGIGTASTGGIYYDGYDTLFLDILRDKTSDVPAPPAAPGSPGAAEITPASIRWTWHDNSTTETSFNVYADLGDGYPGSLRATTAADTTSWNHTGLLSNARYSLQVTAANGVSQSLRTPRISAVTLAGPPAVGTNVICDRSLGRPYALGAGFTFTSSAGFGVDGRVSGFQYVWNEIPTHTWSGLEAVWNSGDLVFVPASEGEFYLHLRSLNQENACSTVSLDYGPFAVDATPPTSAANPTGGVYLGPMLVELAASEDAVIHYTADGTEPTTASDVYASPITLSSDATVRFFAVDVAGNAESAKRTAAYRVLDSPGSIAAVKKQAPGSQVRLGDKVLYWKTGTLGYIEEPDRSNAIRIAGQALPVEGSVCLTGTLHKITSTHFRVVVDAITRTGPGAVRPLGARVDSLKLLLMSELYVRAWGMVKPGSVTASSFVLIDGSDTSGISVVTSHASASVQEGDFVSVTGALGFSGSPLIYASEIICY